MTRLEFAEVLAYIAAATGKGFTEQQTNVYFDLLGDLPLPALQYAAKRSLVESRYNALPTVGVLRQLATAAIAPHMGYDEAWLLVTDVARHYMPPEDWLGDPPRPPDAFVRSRDALPEPARHAAEVIGWRSLAFTATKGMATLHAQFRDAYNAGTNRINDRALLPPSVRKMLTDGVGRQEELAVELKLIGGSSADVTETTHGNTGDRGDTGDAPHDA